MNEIFRFTYNDIEYRVIKNEYSYIPLKMIDGKEVYKLSQDELDIVGQVFKKIKLTNNRIKLPNYRYLDKEYEHFYDKVNHYHVFLNLDGSSLSTNEFVRLNMLFNSQSDIMYDGNIKESKLKRLVNIGKKIVLVLVISSSFIGANENLIGVSAKEIKIEKKEELSSYQKIENLMSSINDNKNLSKKEKEFILNSYKDVIYDNIDLIDYDSVKEKFETLDINYIKESNESIKGEYDIIGNYINIYNFENDSFNKKTMEHELFHVLQGDCLNPGLYEPLNNVFVNEYIGKKETNKNRTYEDGYTYLTKYMYVLMEIVNPESLRYYNFTGDDTKLKEELMSIINDESTYYDLISYYNLARYGNSIDDVTMRNVCIKIEDSLNKYYTTKYNESMYTNIEIVETLYSDSIYDFFKSDIDINEKIYLNNYYKDKNKKTKIKYSKDNKSISTKKLVKDKEFQKLVKKEKNNLFKNGYDYSEIVYGNIRITSNNNTLSIIDNETTYNLNSMYSKKIINSIDNGYFNYINSFNENKNDILIECNIYNSIASIIINSSERKVFNIDLTNGEELGLDKIMSDLGITKEDILNSVLEYFSSYESKDKIKSDMERFIKEGYKTYYIDKNGNLCFDSVCNNKNGLSLKKITTNFSYSKDINIKK